MTVKELIKKLSSFDQNLEVICYTEDEEFQAEGHMFRLLEIDHIDKSHSHKMRNDDGIPSMRFDKSDVSRLHVFIHVIGDF